jgi:ubiquinone/menaquinone biosynthesis C-methylase UbiE
MAESHIFDPKHIDALESEDRETWQNPEEIIELLVLKPSYVVADLGCGTGYFTIPLSRKVKKVYGIDILSTENEIPLQNESIDLLLSVNTLHEFRDKDAIVREMRRVLRADGRAAIIDFKKEDTGFGPPVSIRLSTEQAKQLFKRNGLTALKTHDLKHHYLIVFGKTGC